MSTQKGYVENESETYLIQMAGHATCSDASSDASFLPFFHSFTPTGPAPLRYGEDENDVHSLN